MYGCRLSHVTEQGEVVLCPADAGHIAGIALVESESFTDPWPQSAFETFLTRRYCRITVAVSEGARVVGYCVLLTVADEGEIANIAVAGDFRGTGVGGRLLDEAISLAKERNARVLFLEVRSSNKAAIRLYKSRGFHQVGRRKGYYQNPPEDALVLQWDEGAILR